MKHFAQFLQMYPLDLDLFPDELFQHRVTCHLRQKLSVRVQSLLLDPERLSQRLLCTDTIALQCEIQMKDRHVSERLNLLSKGFGVFQRFP